MFKENFDIIFNLYLVQFIFNNIIIINLIKRLIVAKINNLYTMCLEYAFEIINLGYNKYRFDKIENDIEGLKNDNKGLKNDIEGLKNDIEELKNDNKGLKNDIKDIKKKLNILITNLVKNHEDMI